MLPTIEEYAKTINEGHEWIPCWICDAKVSCKEPPEGVFIHGILVCAPCLSKQASPSPCSICKDADKHPSETTDVPRNGTICAACQSRGKQTLEEEA